MADRARPAISGMASSTARIWWPTSSRSTRPTPIGPKPTTSIRRSIPKRARFLDFETWWGSPVLLNAGEMQWIADNLFVGNKLSTGQIRTVRRRAHRSAQHQGRRSSCSAPGATTSRRRSRRWTGFSTSTTTIDEIVANGQTIVYTMHQTIGHLGIFVSGKVAAKEHGEFVSCMEMIDVLPPGLYEAVITEVDEDTANPNLVDGKYLFRLESAHAGRHPGARRQRRRGRCALRHRRARLARSTSGSTGRCWQPAVRGSCDRTGGRGDARDASEPPALRVLLRSESDDAAGEGAGRVGPRRRASRSVADNPLLAMERATPLVDHDLPGNAAADSATRMTEAVFLNTYGSPLLQALVGLGEPQEAAAHRIERDLVQGGARGAIAVELERRFEVGGLEEAVLRALIYIRLPEGSVDERGFAMLKIIRESRPAAKRMSLSRFREMLREQYLLVRLDEERAIEARAQAARGGDDEHARRRWTCCAGSSRRAARCQTRADAAWTRIEKLFGARDGKPVEAGGRHMSDTANRTTAVAHDKYDRLINGGADGDDDQGGRRASVRRCLVARVRRGGATAPDRAHPCRPGGARCGAVAAHVEHRHQRDRDREFRAQPRLGREGGRAGDRRAGRGADEGQPAHR